MIGGRTIAVICHKWQELLKVVRDAPVFDSGLLLAGDVNPKDVRRQLSRWVGKGRLYQLRRGLYALAPPFQNARPHPFLIANRFVRGSYVSLQSALAHWGMIPEYVPVTTSVTTGRPGRWETPLGTFEFHHVRRDLFTGCRRELIVPGQYAYVATPAKALVDLVHMVPGGDAREYLGQLRLARLDQVDFSSLEEILCRPKLRRAVSHLRGLMMAEARD